MSILSTFLLRKTSHSDQVDVLFSQSSSQHHSLPSADQVSLFGFPTIFQLGRFPRAFILTQENGSRYYGAALSQVFDSIHSGYANNSKADEEVIPPKSALSLIILSELPSFDAMRKLLPLIFPFQSIPNPAQISSRASVIFPVIPYPLPGSAVEVNIHTSTKLSNVNVASAIFSLPSLHEHPSNRCSDADFNLLFKFLPPCALVAAVRALLLEQRIVIHVADGPLESILAPVCEALLSLLYPLHSWPHAYAPLLPLGAPLEEILQSPVPVFIGTGSTAFAQLDTMSLDGVVEINLDAGTVLIPGEGIYGVNPPHTVQNWFGSPTVGFRSSVKIQPKSMMPAFPIRIQKSLIESLSRASLTHISSSSDLLLSLSSYDSPIEVSTTTDNNAVQVKYECRNWEQRSIGDVSSTSRSFVQKTFLDAMLLLVGDYDEHMQEITNSLVPTTDGEIQSINSETKCSSASTSAAAYLGLHFDRTSALACKKEYEPFVSTLYGTQLFDNFLSQRLRVSAWTDQSVLFFDAIVDTVITGSPSPFLQGIHVTGEQAFIEGTKPMLSITISGEIESSNIGIQQFDPLDFVTTFHKAIITTEHETKSLLQTQIENKMNTCLTSPSLKDTDETADIPLCFASPTDTASAMAVAKVVRNRTSIAGDLIKRERLRSKRISNMHELRIIVSPTEPVITADEISTSEPSAPLSFPSRFLLPSWTFKSTKVATKSATTHSTHIDSRITTTSAPIASLPPSIPAFDALRSPLPASHITAALASPIVNGQSIRKRRRMLHDTTHSQQNPLLPPSLPELLQLPAIVPQSVDNNEETIHTVHFSNFVSDTSASVENHSETDVSRIKTTPKTNYIAQLEQRVACLEQALEVANETIRSLMSKDSLEDTNENEEPISKRVRVVD
jgi:hypothetical protein